MTDPYLQEYVQVIPLVGHLKISYGTYTSRSSIILPADDAEELCETLNKIFGYEK